MTQQSIESLYEQALNRKNTPEESSYTNYLYTSCLLYTSDAADE